jgi:hypothetical protein
MRSIFDEKFLDANPPKYREGAAQTEAAETVSYSSDEEEEIQERLKGLGYIE